MRLIPSDPADPDTAALLDEYFAERTAGFPSGTYRAVPPAADMFAPPGLLIRVDDEDGRPLAVGGVRPLPGDPLRMEVKHLYVVPDARGTGIGRRLLTRLEEAARDAGAAQVVLDTNRSLEAAGGLYRAAGYAPIPAYNDNPNATDWFGKALD